jgi:hypothetical protein
MLKYFMNFNLSTSMHFTFSMKNLDNSPGLEPSDRTVLLIRQAAIFGKACEIHGADESTISLYETSLLTSVFLQLLLLTTSASMY